MTVSEPPPVSVLEMKAALETEQQKLVELSEASIQSIGALLSLSQWVLGILGFLIAGIALFGWWNIRRATVSAGEKRAHAYMKDYVRGEKFAELVDSAVAQRMREEWENQVAAPALDSSDKAKDEEFEFPQPKKGG